MGTFAENAASPSMRVALAVALQSKGGGSFDRQTRTKTVSQLLQVCTLSECIPLPDASSYFDSCLTDKAALKGVDFYASPKIHLLLQCLTRCWASDQQSFLCRIWTAVAYRSISSTSKAFLQRLLLLYLRHPKVNYKLSGKFSLMSK